MVGDPYPAKGEQTITNWFNRDAVVAPADISQPFGNAPRNSVRGPMYWQTDFAVSKHFAVSSSSNIEFRVEAFNLLNRTNFRPPNGNRSSGAFGTKGRRILSERILLTSCFIYTAYLWL